MIIFCSSEYANRTVGLLGVQRFVFEKFVDAKIHNSKTLETFSLIWRLLLLAALVGCAASQAAHEIQEGRRALLTGSPETAVQYFEKAAALDSKNAGSPLRKAPGHTSDAPTMEPEIFAGSPGFRSGCRQEPK